MTTTKACAGRYLLEETPQPHGQPPKAVESVRLSYAALYLWIIGWGVVRSAKPSAYLAAICAILVGTGLFAAELSALGFPGIWFPFGVGVARGQYAYAGFVALFFPLILIRLVGVARRR